MLTLKSKSILEIKQFNTLRALLSFGIGVLFFSSPLLTAQTETPVEYRKVQLATMNLQFEDITNVNFDKDGYAIFKFEASVSPDGVVTDVKQIEGEVGPAADNLKSQVMKYTYLPEIRNFKAAESKSVELIWLGTKPGMPPYPGMIDNCEVMPTKRYSPEIIYPASLNLKRIGGNATIQFEVSPEGKVENAKSIEYTNELFARHARIGMSDWTYEPVTKNGKYIRCYAYMSVNYEPW